MVIIVSNIMFAAMIEEWTQLKYYKALLIKYTQIIDPRYSMDNDNLGWVYILDYNQLETLIRL